MTGPEQPRDGLPVWPTVPSADEAPPTTPHTTPPTTLPPADATPPTAASTPPAATRGAGPDDAPDARTPVPVVLDEAAAVPGPVPDPTAEPTADDTALPVVAPAAPGGRAALGPWLVVAALGLVVVLLAVASFALLKKDGDQSDRADRLIALAAVQDPAGPALRAAATAVETLLSYDYATLDADFAAGQKLLTPSFATKYAQFTTTLVRPPALQAKAKVVATLQVLAATEASRADRAVVLAFVDQRTTSTLLKQPAVDQSRLTLTLVPVDGRWLVCSLVVTGSAAPAQDPCAA